MKGGAPILSPGAPVPYSWITGFENQSWGRAGQGRHEEDDIGSA